MDCSHLGHNFAALIFYPNFSAVANQAGRSLWISRFVVSMIAAQRGN